MIIGIKFCHVLTRLLRSSRFVSTISYVLLLSVKVCMIPAIRMKRIHALYEDSLFDIIWVVQICWHLKKNIPIIRRLESMITTMPPKRAKGLLMGILDISKHFLSISPIRWQKYHQHNSSQSQDHLARPYRPTGLPMSFFIWCCRVKFSKTTIWIHKSVTLSQGLYLILAWCRIYSWWQTPLNSLVTHIRVANPSISLIGPRENLQKMPGQLCWDWNAGPYCTRPVCCEAINEEVWSSHWPVFPLCRMCTRCARMLPATPRAAARVKSKFVYRVVLSVIPISPGFVQ